MNANGTVQRAQILAPPAGNFWPAAEMQRQASDALHLEGGAPHTNAYIGPSRKEPPYRPTLIYFLPKSQRPADDADPTRMSMQDNPVTERTLLEHYFPEVTDGGVQPHNLLWFLIDESGSVMRTGRSPNPPSTLQAELATTRKPSSSRACVTREPCWPTARTGKCGGSR